jgi:DNA-binding ferritin-like protein
MTIDNVISVIENIEGYQTRLKELHWNTGPISIHKLIDEFQEELGEFEDSIVENAIPFVGFFEVGTLKPELPEETTFSDVLEGIRGLAIGYKRQVGESLMWSGTINIIDDFLSTVNKFIYLVKIEQK